MYINDIAEKLISLTRLFADDTSFSYFNRDENFIKCFRKITEYKTANFLFSSEFKMQLYISNSWCTVEYFGRKPD
jgi:hypothetical protein